MSNLETDYIWSLRIASSFGKSAGINYEIVTEIATSFDVDLASAGRLDGWSLCGSLAFAKEELERIKFEGTTAR